MIGCARPWRLYKESFAVLSRHSEILLFPVISAVCTMVLAVGFFVPLYRLGALVEMCRGEGTWNQYVGLFAWYYLTSFLFVFFNTALVGCATIRLVGGTPSISAGLRLALARTPRIALWAFVSSALGPVLRLIHSRRNMLKRAVGTPLTASWTMVTYLVVPVLLVEDRGVSASVERSRDLFRHQWGPDVIGSFGFGVLNVALSAPGILAALALWRFDHAAAAVVMLLVYALFQGILSSAVSGIFQTALYLFAVTGKAPEGFTADALNPNQAIWLPDPSPAA